MSKVFYRMRLLPDTYGLTVNIEEWVSIRETDCFCFCVGKWAYNAYKNIESDIDAVRQAKKNGSLKRIAKKNSRFAFESKDEALEHLKLLKKKQLWHMEKDRKFIRHFLKCERFEDKGNYLLLPDSKELVNEYYVFDY